MNKKAPLGANGAFLLTRNLCVLSETVQASKRPRPFLLLDIDLPSFVEANCLVSSDDVPHRSWPLFRAKAMLGDLIAGFSSPSIRSHKERFAV